MHNGSVLYLYRKWACLSPCLPSTDRQVQAADLRPQLCDGSLHQSGSGDQSHLRLESPNQQHRRHQLLPDHHPPESGQQEARWERTGSEHTTDIIVGDGEN